MSMNHQELQNGGGAGRTTTGRNGKNGKNGGEIPFEFVDRIHRRILDQLNVPKRIRLETNDIVPRSERQGLYACVQKTGCDPEETVESWIRYHYTKYKEPEFTNVVSCLYEKIGKHVPENRLVVAKFGGAPLQGKGVRRAAEGIIGNVAAGNKVVAAVSAKGNETAERLAWLVENRDAFEAGIRAKYPESASKDPAIFRGLVLSEIAKHLAQAELSSALKLRDKINSMLPKNMKQAGIEAVVLDPFNGSTAAFPIVADSRYFETTKQPLATKKDLGESLVDNGATNEKVRQHVVPKVEEGKIVIVPGFVGVTKHGLHALLGPGGTDTTAASLFAHLIDALGKSGKFERFVLHYVKSGEKVRGLHYGDPNVDPNAEFIPDVPIRKLLRHPEKYGVLKDTAWEHLFFAFAAAELNGASVVARVRGYASAEPRYSLDRHGSKISFDSEISRFFPVKLKGANEHLEQGIAFFVRNSGGGVPAAVARIFNRAFRPSRQIVIDFEAALETEGPPAPGETVDKKRMVVRAAQQGGGSGAGGSAGAGGKAPAPLVEDGPARPSKE